MSPNSYGLQERVGVKNPREFKGRAVTRMEVSLPDPAVIRDANVFLIKDCFFCQSSSGARCALCSFFLLGYSAVLGCSGQQ